jgi:uncharacterized membrane protein
MEARRDIKVRVTNKNKETFSDQHAGVTYDFEPGETVSLPLEAAQHIFGYKVHGADPKTMFDHVSKRWGWNTPENVRTRYKDITPIWSKFEFTPVAVKYVETAMIDTSALAEPRGDAEQGDEEPSIPDLKLGEPSIAA